MRKSHLVSILRGFSKKELRLFKKWLASPIHNQREDVVDLFNFLIDNPHLFQEEALDKAKVFAALFPSESFDDAKMRQVIFFFMKQVESFLFFQEISQDEIQTKIVLSSVYRKRKLDKLFLRSIKQVEQLQEQQLLRDGHFYRNQYQIQQELYAYFSQVNRIDTNLQEISDDLDTTYIADKLRISCLILTHQNIYKTTYQVGMLSEILTYVEEKALFDTPAIAIYYYYYKAVTDPDNEQHFQELKSLLSSNASHFSSNEFRDINLLALNYCIKKANAGNESFIREAFELYRVGLEESVFIENGLISRWTFINIITHGLKLKEFAWVDEFIHDYQQFLEAKHQESIVEYNLARLHYEQKDYVNSMQLLTRFYTDETIVHLSAKSMLLKMYYEEEEFKALESLLESMRN